jgi:Ni2+-binding GTPase involved in maturation of urease and hydrogenase
MNKLTISVSGPAASGKTRLIDKLIDALFNEYGMTINYTLTETVDGRGMPMHIVSLEVPPCK